MRRLAQRKTRLIFETEDCVFELSQNRQIIIEARPAYCYLRLKGQRKRFAVCYAAIYQYAIELAEKRESIAAPQQKRRAAAAKKARAK